MDIFVIGPERSERAECFQQYAREHGHSVHRLPPGDAAACADRPGAVVVVFDGAALAADLRERTRYLGAAVVAADAPDADILNEATARADAEAISPEVQAELVEPMVGGVGLAFQEMLGSETALRAAYRKKRAETLGDVCGVIRLFGTVEGALVVNFPEQGARAAAARMLGDAANGLSEELVRDCVGEIANVIAGQGKSLLHGTRHGFTISTPTVLTGAGQAIRQEEGLDCLVMVFAGDLGEFALQLCLRL